VHETFGRNGDELSVSAAHARHAADLVADREALHLRAEGLDDTAGGSPADLTARAAKAEDHSGKHAVAAGKRAPRIRESAAVTALA
jgi:phage portal protein BeeE